MKVTHHTTPNKQWSNQLLFLFLLSSSTWRLVQLLHHFPIFCNRQGTKRYVNMFSILQAIPPIHSKCVCYPETPSNTYTNSPIRYIHVIIEQYKPSWLLQSCAAWVFRGELMFGSERNIWKEKQCVKTVNYHQLSLTRKGENGKQDSPPSRLWIDSNIVLTS